MTVARAILGRTFLHPALDYLLIGGGLALLVGIAAFLDPPRAATAVSYTHLTLPTNREV